MVEKQQLYLDGQQSRDYAAWSKRSRLPLAATRAMKSWPSTKLFRQSAVFGSEYQPSLGREIRPELRVF